MSSSIKAGAVLYARSIHLLGAFYQAVTGLEQTHTESDHLILESPTFQLVILQVPAAVAASIDITVPPKRRTEVPVKLVFPVGNIAQARAAAARQGGELNPVQREWEFQGARVCDGQDPEGNVIQVRQPR
jgi:predicted enzyme related to lactoylglutathione lyase